MSIFFPLASFSYRASHVVKARTGYLSLAVTMFHTQALFSLGSEKCVAFLQHFICASIFNGDGKGGLMRLSWLVLLNVD